ncbi:TPA: hypothetical protein ACLGO4_004745 [Salmonella enterica]
MKGFKLKGFKFRLISIKPFQAWKHPKSAVFRAKFWGAVIRLFMQAGYTVCLTGYPRTGKSYLLNKLTPGQVIDARPQLIANKWKAPVPFSIHSVKPGLVGLDETSYFSLETLRDNAGNLLRRKVIYTAQRIGSAVDIAVSLRCRKLLIIYIGAPFSAQCEIAHIELRDG